jgi:hypothetical protein
MYSNTNEMVYKVYATRTGAERYITRFNSSDTNFVIEEISNQFYVVAKW